MFKLPEYIEATGIGEMRNAYHEKVRDLQLSASEEKPVWMSLLPGLLSYVLATLVCK